jgi:hypothetical protein
MSALHRLARVAARSRPGLLIAGVGVLVGCGPERAVAPVNDKAERVQQLAAAITKQYPGALTRTVRGRAGPLTQGQVRGRLGTPETHPGKWSAFQTRAGSPTAASRLPASAPTVLGLQSAIADTLFGTLQVVVGGVLGEVSVGSRATQNGSSVSNIEGWAYPTVYVGTELPYDPPVVFCTSAGFFCSAGELYIIDCEATGGSRVRANSDHFVLYVSGRDGDGHVDRDKSCFPTGGGNNGNGGGGSTTCETWIVEMSNDGGVTWYEIGRFTICDG